jgi:hypothetical protein
MEKPRTIKSLASVTLLYYRKTVSSIDPPKNKISKNVGYITLLIFIYVNQKSQDKISNNFKIFATEENEPARILTYLTKKSRSRLWSFLLSPVLPGRSSLFLSSV